MKITTDEIMEVNRRLGGSLLSESSLKFAEAHCKNIKSTYKRASIWVRAILIDHPFTDANKRTTLYVIRKHVKIKNQIKIERAIIRIAVKNITSIKKIEEMLKNANRQ